MIAITKGMVALSALASASLVTAYDISAPTGDPESASYQVAYRFPRADENFVRVTPVMPAKQTPEAPKPVADGRKGDKLPINTTNCGQREWPYIAHACLVSTSGSPVRKISRVVTIERQVAQN